MHSRKILDQFPQIINPNVRHDFEIQWLTEDGAPGRDPDQASEPRQLPDGRIMSTDATFKRMQRDYGEEVLQRPIYISRAAKERGESLKDQSSKHPTLEDAIRYYWDVRLYGAAYLAEGKKDKNKKKPAEVAAEAGAEASAESGAENGQILGPFQLGMGRSAAPVEVNRLAITRILKEENSDSTFGAKSFCDHVVITHKGRYSGHIGKKMGVTESDMADYWESVINCPELRVSSTSGFRRTVGLTITTYKDPYGFEVLGTVSIPL